MSEKPVKRKHVGSYTLGATIGQGAFGKVKLGTDIFTGENVAIKILRYKNVKTEKEKKQIEREQNILLRLKHPNIVNLKKVVNDEKRGRSYMIFEYASQGELFDYIVSHGRLAEKDARKFMRQIVSALEYCHALLIIHRDLKPENLLLDDGYNIKISDFGLSNIMEPGKRFNTFCGSLHYACPEILRGEEYVGPGVDIWSIGVILYCLVVGRQPWDAENAEGLIHAILEDGLEVPSGLSDDCVDLLLQMLRVSEYDRIPIAKIRTHPWIIEGYGEPPPSYLPPSEPITEIDESILDNLVALNFLASNEPEYLVTIREELLSNKRTQLVVVYNLLLQQKREKLEKIEKEKQAKLEKEKQEKEKQEKEKQEKENQEKEKQESEKKELQRAQSEKKKSSVVSTSDNGAGEKTAAPAPLSKSELPSLGNSIAVSGGKKKKKAIVITARGESTPEKPKKKLPSKRGAAQSPGGQLNPTVDALSANRRQRSVSMSPHNARPVIDFDNVKQGKLTPQKPQKKRSQTPQKVKRPAITEEVFKPPEGDPASPEIIAEATVNIVPENISSKPLNEIVDEILRVLQKEEIRHRKRKNKFIWKCSAEISNEPVQLELEIMKVKNNNFGIVVRRMQGSFPNYQVLYNRIKKELNL
jgi:serine/threonine protein kinase